MGHDQTVWRTPGQSSTNFRWQPAPDMVRLNVRLRVGRALAARRMTGRRSECAD